MAPSTYNHEHRQTNKTLTKLNTRSLSIAIGMSTGLVYTICILFIVLAPKAGMTFFSYILHIDFSNMARVVTWGSFIAGLLFWVLGPALYATAISRLYNRLTPR